MGAGAGVPLHVLQQGARPHDEEPLLQQLLLRGAAVPLIGCSCCGAAVLVVWLLLLVAAAAAAALWIICVLEQPLQSQVSVHCAVPAAARSVDTSLALVAAAAAVCCSCGVCILLVCIEQKKEVKKKI